jgi:hypothetical protein
MFPPASVGIDEPQRLGPRGRSFTTASRAETLVARAVFNETRDAAYRGVRWSRLSQGDTVDLLMSVVGKRYGTLGARATVESKASVDALIAELQAQFDHHRPARADIDALSVIKVFAARLAEVLDAPSLSSNDRIRLIHQLLGAMVHAEYEDYIYPEQATVEGSIRVLNTVIALAEPAAYPVMLASSRALETGSPAPIDWLAEGDWRELRMRAVRSSCSCGVDFLRPVDGDDAYWIADHLGRVPHQWWTDQGGREDGVLSPELDTVLGPVAGSLRE